MYKQKKDKRDKHGYMYLSESTNLGQLLAQCLHERIEEISTLLAWSIRVSTKVTRQGEPDPA